MELNFHTDIRVLTSIVMQGPVGEVPIAQSQRNILTFVCRNDESGKCG